MTPEFQAFTILSFPDYVNGGLVELDVSAQIRNDCLFVALRFPSEALGANVAWNAETKTSAITR
ncbi:MAG: copper amine oxidase N-terminal domain-containing protein [Clostridiales bacterium]|nr:copper amine oxidase N-terminal domain-containing protein [Clostridiales bacterium]